MPSDIREYLAQRFRSDAETLRARAAALQVASTSAGPALNKPTAGPDAALSLAMAHACDEVVTLAEALPQFAPLTDMLAALRALLPELSRRADAPAIANKPAVRAVYAGAATRVQEVIAAERQAEAASTFGSETGGEITDEFADEFADEFTDDDFADDDFDDDDVDDDDINERRT